MVTSSVMTQDCSNAHSYYVKIFSLADKGINLSLWFESRKNKQFGIRHNTVSFFYLTRYYPIPWRDSISRPIAPISVAPISSEKHCFGYSMLLVVHAFENVYNTYSSNARVQTVWQENNWNRLPQFPSQRPPTWKLRYPTGCLALKIEAGGPNWVWKIEIILVIAEIS
jgi:hypothetical protein